MILEVNVQNQEVVRARLDDGPVNPGQVLMPPLRLQTIQLLRKWLESGQIREREALEVLGSHLYEAIFNGAVDRTFQNALRQSIEKGKDEKLRVRLYFQEEAVALSSLPWEFMYKPEEETQKGYFLSTKTELTLFRYMPGVGRSAAKEQLRVLVAFAEPAGEKLLSTDGKELLTPEGDPLTIERMKQDMETVFKKLNIEAKFLPAPTADSLPACLKDFNPHVLHFVGHGLMNKERLDSRIGILNAQGRLIPCPETLFAQYLDEAAKTDLRLVLLHLTECSHAFRDVNMAQHYATFSGTALALLKGNIPAVVAMQFPMKNEVAKKFYESFYAELAQGNSIDSAVQSGRQKIDLDPEYYETPIFATPVLFVQKENGVVEKKVEGAGQSRPSDTSRIDMPQEQKTQPVPVAPSAPTTAPTVDLSKLRKRADAQVAELGLAKEQQDAVGKIISQLYQEKRGQGNYKGVLDNAIGEYSDYQVQQVIFAMVQELEA